MYVFDFFFCALLFFLDCATKFFAAKYLKNKLVITFIKNVINLDYVENRGAAFGILQNQKFFLAAITIITLVVFLKYFFSLSNTKVDSAIRFSIILIFSGAIGNFLNRILNGYVIDFIEFAFIDFPVFNLADIFLFVGFAMFGFITLFIKN